MRSLRPISALALLAATHLVACDDDGGGSPKTKAVEDPGTVQAGQTAGRQSAALTQIQPAAGAEGAQAQFGQVGNALQVFVSNHQTAKAQAAQGSLAVAQGAQTAENSFSYEDGHLVSTVNYADGMTTFVYNVDLQIDPVEAGGFTLDGAFNMDLQTTQQMFEVDYNIDADYDGLALDTAGCPVAGVLTVDYAITVGGAFLDSLPPEAREQATAGAGGSGRLVATYGPACGDVAVEGT